MRKLDKKRKIRKRNWGETKGEEEGQKKRRREKGGRERVRVLQMITDIIVVLRANVDVGFRYFLAKMFCRNDAIKRRRIGSRALQLKYVGSFLKHGVYTGRIT